MELRSLSPDWRVDGERILPSRVAHAAISDETSPPSIVLFLKGYLCNIAYAKLGSDERWALVDGKGWRSAPEDRRLLSDRDRELLKCVWSMSVMTLRGRVYFATLQGSILKLRLHPRPRLELVIKDNFAGAICLCVMSYLVPADDNGRGMLMVRYFDRLSSFTRDDVRRMKRRKKTNLTKMPSDDRTGRYKYNWHLLEVFKVDIKGKKLIPAQSIGQRAVFVGDVRCVSLSSRMFPSVYADAVYLGYNSHCSIPCGLRHLGCNRIEPRLDLVLEGGGNAPFGFSRSLREQERVVPHARPCSLEEYLVCYVGIKNGIKD
ncbi:hypothetical protein QOZ80_3AG0218720 [Eleusine coracana subsp. coracana]|nr:hypothetical protein QOZ80_3AG0218720 [Eleusine coracana subsp. coracana]